MTIKNFTNKTISISLFGHNYEIEPGWSLSSEEVWGGEETLRYIAVKHREEVEIIDYPEGIILCPACGNEITIEKTKEVEEVEESQEKSKKRGRKKGS